MATNFKTFPAHVPTDGQLCAIRVFTLESTAFIATWNETSEEFLVDGFATRIPWYCVVQWRHQNTP
jgi:hypothetical protein